MIPTSDIALLIRAHEALQQLIEWEIETGGWEAAAWKDARATYKALRKHLGLDKARPRFDLAAQVSALGADSLLPPEKRKPRA